MNVGAPLDCFAARAVRFAIPGLVLLVLLQQLLYGIPVGGWNTIRSVFLVALYLLAVRRAGIWFARALSVSSPPGLSLLTGTALLSLWPLIPGSFGLLHPLIAAAPLILLPLCSNPFRDARDLHASWQRFVQSLSDAAARNPLLLVVAALACGWSFLAVLAPPTGMDALTYHLGLGQQYLLRESVIPPDTIPYYTYWQCYEMAILPLLALDSSGEAVNLLGFVFLLLLADGVRRLGRCWGGDRAGFHAAVAVVTSPIIMIVLTHTKSDILSAAFLIWAFIGDGVEADSGAATRLGFRRAFLLGAALAVKPTNIVVVLPTLALEMGYMRRSWKRIIPYGAALSLLPSYWVIRNLLLMGRPFSPDMIQFVDPPGQSMLMLAASRLDHLIRSFFTGYSSNIDGPIGPLILVYSIAALMGLGHGVCRGRRGAAFLGIAGVIFWMAFGLRQSRFLLPVFLLLTASGAAYAVEKGRILRWALLLVAIISLGSGIRILHPTTSFLSLQTGRLTPDQYRLRWLNTWSLQQWANDHLPLNTNLVSVGETRFAPLTRRVIFDGYWQRPRVLDWAHETHSETHLAARLISKGFSHVILNPPSYHYDVDKGHSPLPLCPRDLEVLHAMLDDSALAVPLRLDPSEPRLGIYELRTGPAAF